MSRGADTYLSGSSLASCKRFGTVSHNDRLVIDLDLLAAFDVIVDDHALGSADEGAPDFYWR